MSEDIYSLLRMAQGGDKDAAGRLIRPDMEHRAALFRARRGS